MNEALAPIAVFAYNRPAHLRRCLSSLAANPEAAATSLTIYCDGSKSEDDAPAVRATVDEAHAAVGFGSLRVVVSTGNLGLGRSIINGVTEQIGLYGELIIVEDDLQFSPFFLKYMNEGLRRYAEDSRVASIHGYCYPLRHPPPAPFFLLGADCLGWATWERAWNFFESDAVKLMAGLRDRTLRKKFDFGGTYPYSKMLRNTAEGRVQSWAIRWYASMFLKNMMTLYPDESLVIHDGSDGSGTNMSVTRTLETVLAMAPVMIPSVEPIESESARVEFERFFRRMRVRRVFEKLRLA